MISQTRDAVGACFILRRLVTRWLSFLAAKAWYQSTNGHHPSVALARNVLHNQIWSNYSYIRFKGLNSSEDFQHFLQVFRIHLPICNAIYPLTPGHGYRQASIFHDSI